MEAEEESPSVEQRLPSTRPIDQRWDRSRGIIFNNVKRNHGVDFTWSWGNGIVFAETPATRRGYAARNLFGSPNTSRQERPPVKPVAKPDLVNNPHLVTEAGMGISSNLLDQLNREKALHNETKTKLATESKKRDEQVAAEMRRMREEIENRAQKLHDQERALSERDQLESRQAAERERALKGVDRALQKREQALTREQAQLDTVIANAKIEAQKAADENIKQLVEAAETREKQSTSDAKRYQVEHRKAMERLAETNTETLRDDKNKLEQALAERRRNEMEMIREAGLWRQDNERLDYSAYHRVWDDVWDAQRYHTREIDQICDLLFEKSRRWRELTLSFDGGNIHPWFPHKYAAIDQGLREFMKSSFQNAESNANALKAMRTSFSDSYMDLTRHAHDSRTLTRYHKFEATNTEYLSTSFANMMLNETPIRALRHSLAEQIEQTSKQLKSAGNQSTKAALQERIELIQGERSILSRILAFFIRYRESEALEALRQSSTFEKEIFIATQNAKEALDQARADWDDYISANPGASADSDVSVNQQRADRQEFLAKYREARKDLDDSMNFMRKRALLEIHLGQTKENEAEIDTEIDKQCDKAQFAMDKSLEEIVSSRGRRARYASSFRAAPVVAIPSAIPVTLESRARQEVELRIQALKQKQKDAKAYSSEQEKRKDSTELQELQFKIKRHNLGVVSRRRAEIMQKSPNDHAAALRVQNEIDALRASIARAESRTKPPEEKIKFGAHRAPLPTAGERKPRRMRIRRVSQSQTAKSTEGGRSVGSSTSSAPTLSDEKQVKGPGGVMNFKPTVAHQAPKSSWMATLRSLYAGNSRESTTTPAASNTMPPEESSKSNDGQMPSSEQPMNSTSIPAHAKDNEAQHMDEEITSSPNLVLSEDESFDAPSENDDSDWSSQVSDDSDAASSPEHSTYQPDEPASSQDRASAVSSEDPTAFEHHFQQDGEVMSPIQLSYRMSPEDYRNAVIASKNTAAAFWTYKLYKNSDGRTPKIYYCINFEQTESRAREFLNEPIVGCDLEWEPYTNAAKSSIKRNVSLIQIAAEDKIGLFHLALFNGDTADKLMPPSLRELLESRNIAKVGVNIAGDASRLRDYLGVNMKGLFELSHLYRVVKFQDKRWEINKKLVKLSTQVQEVLLLPLKKDAVRTSAWSKRLNMEQSEYAASDAYAGFQLYHKLEAARVKLNPMPDRPAFWEDHKPLQLGNGEPVESKPYIQKRKRAAPNDSGKGAEVDDDECEDYFDTVENIDTEPLDPSLQRSSQRSGNSDLSHLSFESSEVSQSSDLAEHSQGNNQSQINRPLSNISSTQSKRAKGQIPPSPEVASADLWVANWRDSLPVEYNLKVGPATLRAYHLWHGQGFDCPTVAAFLRDPPLAPQTVASYVMTAVKEENLDFDAGRIKEPLELLPQSVHGRYRKVLERNGVNQ